jgi:transcription elongation GreA/GreB family factor
VTPGRSDLANSGQGKTSSISPIARALVVEVRTPVGPETIEIISIRYSDDPS